MNRNPWPVVVAPERSRRQAERRAILSSCCGFTGEAVLTESAVIMLYAGMLGAGEALKLLTTAVFPLLSGLLMLPMAALAMRGGGRRLTIAATLAAGGAYLAAPWAAACGAYQVTVLLGLLIFFSISLSGFVAGWFPLLDTFLLPERRTRFIGRMRFCHQSSAVGFLLAAGWWIGRSPQTWQLQLVIGLAGLIFFGRALFIVWIPQFPAEKPSTFSWYAGLRTALRNQKLLRSAVYIFLLNLGTYGMVPLWILYLQQAGAPDNLLIYVSAATLAGMMAGYWSAGRLLASSRLRDALLKLQIGVLAVGMLLLVLPAAAGGIGLAVAGGLLALYSFGLALVSVGATGLMLETATPGNKTMAMAVFGALGNTGMGLSRLLAALLLNVNDSWRAGGLNIPIFPAGMALMIVLVAAAFMLRPKPEH